MNKQWDTRSEEAEEKKWVEKCQSCFFLVPSFGRRDLLKCFSENISELPSTENAIYLPVGMPKNTLLVTQSQNRLYAMLLSNHNFELIDGSVNSFRELYHCV